MSSSLLCPCSSGKYYAVCCQPFIDGNAVCDSAEQLMRSRYTAYTQAKIEYIQQTMRGVAAQGFDPQSAENWARSLNWRGLSVKKTGEISADQAFVSFVAKYQDQGRICFLREKSLFKKIAGVWYYIDRLS